MFSIWLSERFTTRKRIVKTARFYASTAQGSVTPIASVLQSATAVKTKVSGQLKIFAIVNGQATKSLMFVVK